MIFGFCDSVVAEPSPKTFPTQDLPEKALKDNVLNGFLDFNAYYDTRESGVFTINALANLPFRLQYFSLTNYTNGNNSKNVDLTGYYTEQTLRWAIAKKIPLDASFQWVSMSGGNNDRARFGFRWRVSSTPWFESIFKKLHMFYAVTFHGLETDFSSSINGTQVEHVYRIQVLPSVLKDRVYISGFADNSLRVGQAVTGGNNSIWVTEHQLGIRLIDWLYAVAEFKRNEFLPAQKNGMAFGLEYVLRFNSVRQ